MSPPKSSLTPQRKHRKLLKDGSGSEVWPEAIEAIFVEALRAYWDSPWATHSGGRARWRNQYLVEYLQGKGITRSKKQVASHLQVLRNMWKGEPEYQLVAGADEQLSQTPHPESDSSSSTPNSLLSLSLPSSPPTSVNNSPNQQLDQLPYFSRRATALTISAQHMTPFHVKIDGLLPPSSSLSTSPAVIKLRLSIPPPASQSLPTLQGFAASVSFSGPPTSIGCCMTKVYLDGAKQNQVSEPLLPSPVKQEDPEMEMYLPDSALTTCRWLQPAKRVGITQEISLDGHPMLYLIYDLDRNTSFPSVQIVKYQRYSTAAAPSASSTHTRKRSRSRSITQAQAHPYHSLYASSSSPPNPNQNYTWGTPSSTSSSTTAPLFQLSSSPTDSSYNFYNHFGSNESSPSTSTFTGLEQAQPAGMSFSSSSSGLYSPSQYQQQQPYQGSSIHQPVYNYS